MKKFISKLNSARIKSFFNYCCRIIIGNCVAVIVCLAIGWSIFKGVDSFVRGSSFFCVDEIEIVLIGRAPLSDDAIRQLLSMHKGENIFRVDLKRTRSQALSDYPEIKHLVINRVYPNKLVLRIRPRTPVAQISLSGTYCLIDTEGLLFPDPKNLTQEGIPIIVGIDSASVLSCLGEKYDSPGLKKALKLLRVLRRMRFSQEHEIHMVDISDERNVSLFIEGGIEIKIGSGDFSERILMLNKTFDSGRVDIRQIKYIDLRFGNVVIRPR